MQSFLKNYVFLTHRILKYTRVLQLLLTVCVLTVIK
jgi:hypothetical protein